MDEPEQEDHSPPGPGDDGDIGQIFGAVMLIVAGMAVALAIELPNGRHLEIGDLVRLYPQGTIALCFGLIAITALLVMKIRRVFARRK